jgi:AraC-like DNA-binding protein
LQGRPQTLSLRSLQYRFLQATGMPYKTIQQIKRAHRAVTLLQQGMSIHDTVYETGYYDQSHLTRSLRHYTGQSPAQLIRVVQP